MNYTFYSKKHGKYFVNNTSWVIIINKKRKKKKKNKKEALGTQIIILFNFGYNNEIIHNISITLYVDNPSLTSQTLCFLFQRPCSCPSL